MTQLDDARRLVRSLNGLGGDASTTLALARRLPAGRWADVAALAEVDTPDAETVAMVVEMLSDIASCDERWRRFTAGNLGGLPVNALNP